jgi:preprotein translocase subunit SecG
MITVILVIHLLIALALVGVILLQRSEGGALGIGGGGGGGLVSGRAAGNLLTRATAILATVFFVTSLTLAILANQTRQGPSITDGLDQQAPAAEQPAASPVPATPTAPTAPAAPAAPAVEPTTEAPVAPAVETPAGDAPAAEAPAAEQAPAVEAPAAEQAAPVPAEPTEPKAQ